MKIRNTTILSGLLLFSACTKFDDAELTDRNSFMYFYSSGKSFEGAVAEIDFDGGYIVGANVPQEGGNTSTLIIKTDPKGLRLWEQSLDSMLINAILPVSEGYLVVGDRIKLNPTSTEISEILNTQTQLMLIDNQGTIIDELIQEESFETVDGKTLQVDFHGNGLTLDKDGNILILGSRKTPGSNERSYVSCIDRSTFELKWSQSYGLVDRDYLNCNSLFVTTSSRLIWASKTVRTLQNLSDQYLSVSYVEPNSTFANNSLLGENEVRNHSPNDIQKSPVGYGITGTYAEQDGSNANIYFVRVDQAGNIVPGSERYFDGINLALTSADRETSATNDSGDAITAVPGGFVIAGSITSTPTVGSGGKDIILIKIDIKGELEWTKLIGGTGDDTANSIRNAGDGALLICGTNTINGLSSVMLIRTDANGEIMN